MVFSLLLALDPNQVERRRAPDGRFYTRDEFVKPGTQDVLDVTVHRSPQDHCALLSNSEVV